MPAPWQRDGVDVAGEQVPQPSSEGDSDRHAHDDPDEGCDGCLPSDGTGELSSGEAEGLEQREVASSPTDRSAEGEAECDDRTAARPAARTQGWAGRLVVHDLGRTLHPEHDEVSPSSLGSSATALSGDSAMRWSEEWPAEV